MRRGTRHIGLRLIRFLRQQKGFAISEDQRGEIIPKHSGKKAQHFGALSISNV
jgi:hypothetical protein